MTLQRRHSAVAALFCVLSASCAVTVFGQEPAPKNNGGNPASAMGETLSNGTATTNPPSVTGNTGVGEVDAVRNAESNVTPERPGASVDLSGIAPVLAMIRSAPIDTRDRLTAQIDQKIQTSEKSLEVARTQAKQLSKEARTDFKTALKEALAEERRLHKTLKSAEKASAEDWPRTRDALATHFEAYSKAVTLAQNIAATGSAKGNTSSTIERR